MARNNSDEMIWLGFPKPINFYPVPTYWIEAMGKIGNLGELKVVEYLMRHTWGIGQYGVPIHISVNEFIHGRTLGNSPIRLDSGTRLSARRVRNGLALAIRHGLIEVHVDSRKPGRMKKSYCLKMRPDAI